MNDRHDPETVEATVEHYTGITPNRVRVHRYDEDGDQIIRVSAVSTDDGRAVFVHFDPDSFRVFARQVVETAAALGLEERQAA